MAKEDGGSQRAESEHIHRQLSGSRKCARKGAQAEATQPPLTDLSRTMDTHSIQVAVVQCDEQSQLWGAMASSGGGPLSFTQPSTRHTLLKVE